MNRKKQEILTCVSSVDVDLNISRLSSKCNKSSLLKDVNKINIVEMKNKKG